MKVTKIEWNYNLSEAPESELILIAYTNVYGGNETTRAQKWNGVILKNGHKFIAPVYAWAKLPEPPEKI